MRTALLSALELGEDGTLRAAMPLGGRSILAWQGEWVRQLGCDRVICLAEKLSGAVLDLQRAHEMAGGEFHVVRSGLHLPALVRADDELVVLLDGLVADRETLENLLCEDGRLRMAVATLPAVHPLAKTHPYAFERIDRERSWAGVAAMRAAPVQQLADLPGDSAPVSLLLRLALQAGTGCREIGGDVLAGGHWMLASTSEGLKGREQALIDRNLADLPWSGPAGALAQEAARRLAPRVPAKAPLVSGIGGSGLLGAGLVMAGFGFSSAGLAIVALGAFGNRLSVSLASISRALQGRSEGSVWPRRSETAVDVIAAMALVLASWVISEEPALASLGLFAVGLARLAAAASGPRGAAFWADRAMHLAVFAVAAALDLLAPVLAIFGLVALAWLLISDGRD